MFRVTYVTLIPKVLYPVAEYSIEMRDLERQ
jgi:hypothetical protein